MKEIPARRRLILIEKAVQGIPVSVLCRQEHISRTIFYRWLKQYDVRGLEDGTLKRIGKKRIPRTITPRVERKVINLSIKRPNLTIRQYAKHAGISTRAVWLILNGRKLSSREQRSDYTASNGTAIYRYTSHEYKISLLKRAADGESISKLCAEAGVSRTIFYKWLSLYKEAGSRFDALKSKRPTGESHYRYIKGLEEAIIAVIERHPEYSLSQILSCLTTEELMAVSRSGIYKILKRYGLTTPEARFAYLVRAYAMHSIPPAIDEEVLPAIPRYSFISFIAPPLQDLTHLLHTLYFDVFHEALPQDTVCDICIAIDSDSRKEADA